MSGPDYNTLFELNRKIGHLEASQHATQLRLDEASKELRAVRGELKDVLAILQTAKGGWRMLIGVGTFSAVIGGLLVKALGAFGIGK